eukprot:TRINITY_DN74445_c0_g1_i1.p1 TRINITY_DN74445_c0_g1~~TRINITY_DN74445_c0_g1_i1.p1  ORF type:complete len:280 (-),score=51.42 TRINITY_DN74445_c0_g1_i1:489-1328(-)
MWCIVDCCGITCCVLAYTMLFSANAVVLKAGMWPLAPNGSMALQCLYQLFFFLSLWSHLACMLSDPGSIPLETAVGKEEKLPEGYKRCSKCRVPKPPRAHHCSICRRCILRMDHHCPWMNNCIGARNQKFFVLFLLYVHLQSWLAVACLGTRMLDMSALPTPQERAKQFMAKRAVIGPVTTTIPPETAEGSDKDLSEGQIVGCIIVFFIAIIFGLFTLIMLCDQVSNITSNLSGIDALQGHAAVSRPWRESVQEVMGRGPSIRWLLPTPVKAVQIKDDQ